VNVKFLVEGEEEAGRRAHRALRGVATGPAEGRGRGRDLRYRNVRAGLPTICVGLRGIVYAELHVEGGEPRPAFRRVRRRRAEPHTGHRRDWTALKDRDGRIQIPGFYDRVQAPAPKEREAWARLPFDEKEYTEKEMGARELVGEPGIPVLERVWARPTLEVHGIRGGFTGKARRP
jgi:hypothetical protein